MTDSSAPARDLASLEREAEDAARRNAGYGAEALILCDRLVRVYAVDGVEVQALQGLDLRVEPGELTAIVGASGSGQVDAAQHPVRPRPADGGPGQGRRARPAGA